MNIFLLLVGIVVAVVGFAARRRGGMDPRLSAILIGLGFTFVVASVVIGMTDPGDEAGVGGVEVQDERLGDGDY